MSQAAAVLPPAGAPEASQLAAESAQSAVPFFPPDSSLITDYDPELFSPDIGAVILPGHTTKFGSLAEVLHNPAVPILAFTPALYQEINYLTATIDTEWAVFLTLKRLSPSEPHFLAFDWFMPLQTARASGVSVDAEDARRYYHLLKEHPYYKEYGLHRHLCHLHSHASMGVFFSKTDDEQQLGREDLGFLDEFRFYAVVNQEQKIKLSFVSYQPILFRAEAVPALLFSRPEYVGALSAERKMEIDARVRALVKQPSGFPGLDRAFPAWPVQSRRDFRPADIRAGARAEAGAGAQERKEPARPNLMVALTDYLDEQLKKQPPLPTTDKTQSNGFDMNTVRPLLVSFPLSEALKLPKAQAQKLALFLAAIMSPHLWDEEDERTYWKYSLHSYFTVLAEAFDHARGDEALDDETATFLDAGGGQITLGEDTLTAMRARDVLRTPDLYACVVNDLTEWQQQRLEEARGTDDEVW